MEVKHSCANQYRQIGLLRDASIRNYVDGAFDAYFG